MAKVKVTDTGDVAPVPDTNPIRRETAVPTDSVNTPAIRAESKAVPPKPAPETDIPVFAKKILKAFRSYPKLYIDSHGSAYTSDTAERLRIGAVLYKNPFYEP